MAGAALELDYRFELERATDALEALRRRGADATPAMEAIGEDLLRSTRERFDAQESPDGEPWAPLSDRYKRRKPKRADEILVLNTFLRDTIRYAADEDSLELGTDRIYGASHQYGDEERGIPQREYLGFSDDDEAMAAETLMDYLSEPLEG